MIDFAEIKRGYSLAAVMSAYVSVRRNAQGGAARCPFHDDRSPSLSIYADDTRFLCHGCGAQGDVIDFLMAIHSVSMGEALAMLESGEFPEREQSVDPAADAERIAAAHATWASTVPATGTAVETYLRSRHIAITIPTCIRFAMLPYGNSAPMPCLAAALTDCDERLTGVHRIFLRSDGAAKANVAKPKLSLGIIRGSAIRLAPLDGAGELVICEGIEDGLSLLQMTGAPVWAVAGASMMASVQFPSEVRAIVIASDNDEAGMRAASRANHAFGGRGLTVRLLRPHDGFKDFNDELRGAKK